jgi:hypothetical protein
MKITFAFLVSLICIQLYACGNKDEIEQTQNSTDTSNTATAKMKITIGAAFFTATLNSNATATAFKERLPMTINMTELNGNEKYVDLTNALPANASNPATIQNGDLMLFGSNTLVLFYKTFSTSYSYTRIGRIENPSGLAAALGSGNATVTFEAD